MRPTRLEKPPVNRNDWKTICTLLPYLWEYKGRVALALLLLVMAKLASGSSAIGVEGNRRCS